MDSEVVLAKKESYLRGVHVLVGECAGRHSKASLPRMCCVGEAQSVASDAVCAAACH